MLFNNKLNKEFVCDKCITIINKKTSCEFDYSHQRRYKNEIEEKLCQNCCIDELVAGLQNNTTKALIVQPSNKFNSYGFYSFKEMTEGSKHSSFNIETDIFCEYLQNLLPKDYDKCKFCSNDAIYTWCDLSIYCGEDLYSFNIPIEHEKTICVCQNCIGDLFRNKIEIDKIHFTYVYPMIPTINESGYYTPWDV